MILLRPLFLSLCPLQPPPASALPLCPSVTSESHYTCFSPCNKSWTDYRYAQICLLGNRLYFLCVLGCTECAICTHRIIYNTSVGSLFGVPRFIVYFPSDACLVRSFALRSICNKYIYTVKSVYFGVFPLAGFLETELRVKKIRTFEMLVALVLEVKPPPTEGECPFPDTLTTGYCCL